MKHPSRSLKRPAASSTVSLIDRTMSGGQCLFVIPDHDPVVVTNACFTNGPEGTLHLLRDVLLVAMTTE